jgi:hypothetical protein
LIWEGAQATTDYIIQVDRPPDSHAASEGMRYTLVLKIWGPTPTPPPLLCEDDQAFEPNYDFEHAAVIELNKSDPHDFAPCDGYLEDNDFFKLRVKPNLPVTCETSALSPGTDTNMIWYSEEQARECGSRPVEQCQGLGGNDDIDSAAGILSSRLEFTAYYEGWLYILVGQGRALPPAEAKNYSYTLTCSAPSYTADPYEPNDKIEDAKAIAFSSTPLMGNFKSSVFLNPPSQDKDYFRVYVDNNSTITCTAIPRNRAVGIVLSLYGRWLSPTPTPSSPLKANVSPDRQNSQIISATVSGSGWVYFMVEHKYYIRPEQDAASFTYDLKCQQTTKPNIPPPPNGASSGVTPSQNITQTPPVTQTPTITPGATITPTPTAIPTLTPTPPPTLTITVRVFYDADNDTRYAAAEAIEGLKAILIYQAGGKQRVLSQLTDEFGQVVFTVRAAGPVIIELPYLGFREELPATRTELDVRIGSQSWPERIP